jgi:hypothetical protein
MFRVRENRKSEVPSSKKSRKQLFISANGPKRSSEGTGQDQGCVATLPTCVATHLSCVWAQPQCVAAQTGSCTASLVRFCVPALTFLRTYAALLRTYADLDRFPEKKKITEFVTGIRTRLTRIKTRFTKIRTRLSFTSSLSVIQGDFYPIF